MSGKTVVDEGNKSSGNDAGPLDDWVKDWTKDLNINPADPEATREFVNRGAHPPRPIKPRNLRRGVYRGGRRPVDLFWRVRNGIEGVPMPAVPPNLPPEDIWAVIEYVRQKKQL